MITMNTVLPPLHVDSFLSLNAVGNQHTVSDSASDRSSTCSGPLESTTCTTLLPPQTPDHTAQESSGGSNPSAPSRPMEAWRSESEDTGSNDGHLQLATRDKPHTDSLQHGRKRAKCTVC